MGFFWAIRQCAQFFLRTTLIFGSHYPLTMKRFGKRDRVLFAIAVFVVKVFEEWQGGVHQDWGFFLERQREGAENLDLQRRLHRWQENFLVQKHEYYLALVGVNKRFFLDRALFFLCIQ